MKHNQTKKITIIKMNMAKKLKKYANDVINGYVYAEKIS